MYPIHCKFPLEIPGWPTSLFDLNEDSSEKVQFSLPGWGGDKAAGECRLHRNKQQIGFFFPPLAHVLLSSHTGKATQTSASSLGNTNCSLQIRLPRRHSDAPGHRLQKNKHGYGDDLLQIMAFSCKGCSRNAWRHCGIVYVVLVYKLRGFISSQTGLRTGQVSHPTRFLMCLRCIGSTWGTGSILHKPS